MLSTTYLNPSLSESFERKILRSFSAWVRHLTATSRWSIAAVLLLLVVMSWASSAFYAQTQALQETRKILEERTSIHDATFMLEKELSKEQIAVLNYRLTHDDVHMLVEKNFADNVMEQIRRLKLLAIDPSLHRQINLLDSKVNRYLVDVRRWMASPWPGDASNPVLGELGEIGMLCAQVNAANDLERESERHALFEIVRKQRTIAIVAGSVVAIMLLCAIGYALSMLRPLAALLRGVQRIENGDLDFELSTSRHAEIGELIKSFNRMTRTARLSRQRLVQESVTDGLTGLYNQRHFRFLLDQEVQRARVTRTHLSLLMIDVDHFKDHNDALGHEFGNRVLKAIAKTIQDHLRATDVLARYGGDELAVILPATSLVQGRFLAERINSSAALLHEEGLGEVLERPVTISIGGASLSDFSESSDELIQSADRALYSAKKSGRARTMWSEPLHVL